MAKLKLNQKQKAGLLIALSVIFLFVVERVFISNLHSRLLNLDRQIKITEKELKKNLDIRKNREEILADFDKYEPYMEKQEVNERQIFAELLKEIESTVSSVGGSIVNLTPDEEPGEDKMSRTYTATFRIEVNFPQLLRFLATIEERKRLIKIERLSVISKNEEAKVLSVDGIVSLVVPTFIKSRDTNI